MPRLNITKEAAALGVGVLDTVLESIDKSQASSVQPYQNFTDWGRTALAVGSGLAYINNMMPELAEPVLYASSALAAKSASRLVMDILKIGTPAMTQLPAARRPQLALMSGGRARAEAMRRLGMQTEEETLVSVL